MDIKSSPTISRPLRRFITHHDGFHRSVATIARGRASNGKVYPKLLPVEPPYSATASRPALWIWFGIDYSGTERRGRENSWLLEKQLN
jgi:hypothetical protein